MSESQIQGRAFIILILTFSRGGDNSQKKTYFDPFSSRAVYILVDVT